ncbi:DedA family protein [Streptomyces sp. NPDC004647]|uniref:DedA family protein n=1 Tax=Streptomyces sp. NPDC004647 TaxID=3154671 RepID=UPI0033ABCCA8
MHVLWTYALLALTTLPPLVPNSGLLVAAGVLASRGSLDIALVLLVVVGSAVLGDLLINLCGHRFSGPVQRWMNRNPKRRALLEWTTLRMQRHGVPFVVAVRFLPSGRLIGGLAAGVVRYPVRRYLIGAGIAETVWAAYTVGLGYLGSAAAGDPFYAAGIGIGASAVVAGVGGLVQMGVRRRGRRPVSAAPVVVACGGPADTGPASIRAVVAGVRLRQERAAERCEEAGSGSSRGPR